MKKNTEEKLAKVQELLKKKEGIERELDILLSPEKEFFMPPDFSLNDEVLSIIRDSGASGISVLRIVAKLTEKYPNYPIERKRVASSLAYLKNTKKQIESAGRAMYKITGENK